jgi:hypothetical protein
MWRIAPLITVITGMENPINTSYGAIVGFDWGSSAHISAPLSIRCFFLALSSFLTHHLDLANAELKKPTKGVSIVRLQSLLELALTGESAS